MLLNDASMGPQLDSCGRPGGFDPHGPYMVLQWGRNLTVAEGPYSVTWMMSIVELQWGRNLTVAEGCIRNVSNVHFLMLQWGRNLTVAEGSTMPGSTFPRMVRFNGAAT